MRDCSTSVEGGSLLGSAGEGEEIDWECNSLGEGVPCWVEGEGEDNTTLRSVLS